MKYSLIILLSFLATNTIAGKYETAMVAAIEQLYKADSPEKYQAATANFERIAAAEQDKWHPLYYASLGCIWASHDTKNPAEIDQFLDMALNLCEKAEKLSENNDEIITLQGYIYMMKVVVDPPTRGPQYSGMAMQEFGKAVGINKENPRALLLMGRMQMGTDQFFGNDLSNSCGMIEKAASMFETQNTNSKLDPVWGKELSAVFVKECQLN